MFTNMLGYASCSTIMDYSFSRRIETVILWRHNQLKWNYGRESYRRQNMQSAFLQSSLWTLSESGILVCFKVALMEKKMSNKLIIWRSEIDSYQRKTKDELAWRENPVFSLTFKNKLVTWSISTLSFPFLPSSLSFSILSFLLWTL